VDFLTAAKRMRADESEPGLPLDAAPAHYADVNLALEAFRREAADGHAGVAAPVAGLPVPARGSRSLKTAATFLRKVGRWVGTGALPPGLAPLLKELEEAIAAGSLAHLEFGLRDLAAAFADLGPLLPPDRAPSLENALRALHAKYFGPARPAAPRSPEEETEPLVVLSETFSEDAAP
jgi:hypothetical protein